LDFDQVGPYGAEPTVHINYFGPDEPLIPRKFAGFSIELYRGGARPAKALAVFIHGLGGKGLKTWHRLPEYVRASRNPQIDVALVHYISGPRRFFKMPRSSVEYVARMLGREITKLHSEYEILITVGHSLGGVISRQTTMDIYLNDRQAISDARQPAGSILLASPTTGTALAFLRLTSDLRFLASRSAWLDRLNQFHTNNVDPSLSRTSSSKPIWQPTFAGIAAADRVVSKTSARNGLPYLQVQEFDCGHTAICKVDDPSHPVLLWLESSLRKVIQQSRTRLAEWDPAVRVDFLDHTLSPSVSSLFYSACDLVLQGISPDRALTIKHDSGPGSTPDLIVRIIGSSRSERDHILRDLTMIYDIHDVYSNSMVAIVFIGSEAQSMHPDVEAWCHTRRNRYMVVADDFETLSDEFQRIVSLAVQVKGANQQGPMTEPGRASVTSYTEDLFG
jgi:hypothetical protein